MFLAYRAPAYGLALATFGLSFCLGPVTGSFIAAEYGIKAVFGSALILVILDVVYIVTTLPESVQNIKVIFIFQIFPVNNLNTSKKTFFKGR
jgi:predicted MFS family arabinose efflux permease